MRKIKMGMFDVFKKGLTKTRDFVSGNINRMSAKMGYFDESMMDDLEMVLVQSDVGASCAMQIIDTVKKEMKIEGNNSTDFVISNIKGKMKNILGEKKTLDIESGKLNIILLVGVNGTGKTTTAGKLCLRYKNENKKIMLAAADTFRAAAIEQLNLWGEKTQTPVISHAQGSDPGAVVFDSIAAAKKNNADVLIIDTAGRLHNKQNLMDELGKINRIIAREAGDSANLMTLLVIDATTGQNATVQARVFNEVTLLSGIALTKLDSNAKGGVAISVANETKIPIMLAGLGEKVEDLVDFDPDLFVDSLFE